MSSLSSSETGGTHYSQSFTPGKMKIWARLTTSLIRKEINKKFKDHKIILIYSGMSGVSHAMYLSSMLDSRHIEHEHIYIRKENESSHGMKIEFSNFKNHEEQTYILVFVDDFISEGITRNRCINKLLSSWIGTQISERIGGLIVACYKMVMLNETGKQLKCYTFEEMKKLIGEK